MSTKVNYNILSTSSPSSNPTSESDIESPEDWRSVLSRSAPEFTPKTKNLVKIKATSLKRSLDKPIVKTEQLVVKQLQSVIKLIETTLGIDLQTCTPDQLRELWAQIEDKSEIIHNSADVEESRSHKNKQKNRYSNISAEQKTRVHLLEECFAFFTEDYINANWVYEKKYIATQGPIDNTINDFWRMMWTTNAKTIVALCQLYEQGKSKCALYWPGGIGVEYEYGQFKVTMTNFETLNGTVEKTMKLINTKTSETRTITQLHFQDWPDNGIPESPAHFVNLVERVRELNTSTAPVVVHCSAGIGRTGTFIFVNRVIDQIKADIKNNISRDKLEIDVCSIVLELRKERSQLIQTVEQFLFAIEVICAEVKKL